MAPCDSTSTGEMPPGTGRYTICCFGLQLQTIKFSLAQLGRLMYGHDWVCTGVSGCGQDRVVVGGVGGDRHVPLELPPQGARWGLRLHPQGSTPTLLHSQELKSAIEVVQMQMDTFQSTLRNSSKEKEVPAPHAWMTLTPRAGWPKAAVPQLAAAGGAANTPHHIWTFPFPSRFPLRRMGVHLFTGL